MIDVRMRALACRLQRDECGLTTVEYVIVLCLIAAAAVGAWGTFGDNVEGYIHNATDKIEAEMPP